MRRDFRTIDGRRTLAPISSVSTENTGIARPPDLLGLRDKPQIRLKSLPAHRELLFCLLFRKGSRNDHIIPGFPVHRRSYVVLGCELKRVQYTQYFVEIAPTRHGIAQ